MTQDHYSYFDIDALMEAQGFTNNEIEQGTRLLKSGSMTLEGMEVGYRYGDDEMVCSAKWGGYSGKSYIHSGILFNRDSILRTYCACPSCTKEKSSRYYNYFETNKLHCARLAGLMLAVKVSLQENPQGDATTRNAIYLLDQFADRRIADAAARASERDQQVFLEPFLRQSEDTLTLSFRIAEKKALLIKDLFEFIDHVDKGETALYGSSTRISHKIDNFDPESKKWIAFIRSILQEEEHTRSRLIRQAEKSYVYYREKKFGALDLYGWRLDRFFEMIRENGIRYESRQPSQNGRAKKVKTMLTCADDNSKFSIQIKPDVRGKNDVFHGVYVDFDIPVLFTGLESYYYIDGTRFCRTGKDRLAVLEPLIQSARKERTSFEIGRSQIAEFYHRVLPQLGDAIDVIEEDPELIHGYLPADVSFRFYLDAQDNAVICRPCALYEDPDTEVSLLDLYKEDSFPHWRMTDREYEIVCLLRRMFYLSEEKEDELTTGENEELVYQFLENGLAQLEEVGEIRATRRFLNLNVIRQVKLSVGVSLQSDLLNLEIATTDLSREELLDVIRACRFKKKYYRLKNGSFLNMDDPTVQMLNEMLSTLQITDKEFLKGQIHVPAYRTLYLNQLLEENDSVYQTRDKRFRAMVRNFKTVREADYEVPTSLRETLRGYQTSGYKWLQTISSGGFGGILADEMGLGKTLQTICLLLAKKEEHAGGVSLVVCPASVVYNWYEEFRRFAPSLQPMTVTGTKAERKEKLAQWQNCDVLITSYDLLKRDIAEYEDKSFAFEIIDEAQYIKNHTTAAAKSVKVVHASHRLALTGTPIENRLSELWSIFDFLMPGFLYRYEEFRRKFETPIVKNQDQEAMQRLQKMVGPFILRRLKTDVLKDLPEKLEESRYIRMEGEQRRLYDAQVLRMQTLLTEQSDEDFKKSRIRILAEITRLRQICCDPSLCIENYSGSSAKLEGCMDLIRSALDGGHRILLFSQFVSMLEIIQEQLEKENIDYFIITGSTSKEKRMQLVKTFNKGKVPVFLVSLKAGGTGLNLTGADIVIHYDPWWNLAVQNQATDRAHRIGQTKKVTVYKIIASQSIEEKIQKLQETKKDLADQILLDARGQFPQLSREDLLALLE